MVCRLYCCLGLLILDSYPVAHGNGANLSTGRDAGLQPSGLLARLEGHAGAIYTLAISERGWLASGARDHSIAIWNTSQFRGSSFELNMKPYRRWEGHVGGVTSSAFSGDFLITGSADNTTRIWDIHRSVEHHVIPHPKTVFGISVRKPSAQMLPTDQDQFATACWDGVIRIFTALTALQVGELRGHEGGVYSVAYSPLDFTLLASASADRTVRVWDTSKVELLWTLRGFGDHVTTVDWSPTTPYTLATGGWDRKFRLWTLASSEVSACRSAGNCSAALNPRLMARHPQLVWRVAFHPGGDLVAACHGAVGQSPTVVIYEVSSGKVVRRLGRHRDTPLVMAWSWDGRVLASAGMDKTILLYAGNSRDDDVPRGDLDDMEEQRKWAEDLFEFRTGSPHPNRSDTINSSTANGDQHIPRYPYPLEGRNAYF